MSSSRLSLAQQIAQLDDAAPVDFDPEDAYGERNDNDNASDDDGDDAQIAQSAARAHYVDVGPSTLRALHDTVDPKYEGVRTSRRRLEEEEEASVDEQFTEDDDEGHMPDDSMGADDELSGRLPSEDLEGDEEDGSEGSEESDKDDDDGPPTPPTTIGRADEPVDDVSTSLRQKRAEDIKKGKAIARQLALWDSVLDARIRLQKAATAANRLPLPADLASFVSDPECKASLDRMAAEALLLSSELLDYRETLLAANDVVQPPPRKRRRTDAGSLSLDSLQEVAAFSSALNAAFHPHLVQTLSKWSAKVQAVAPSVLLPSSRTSFSRSSAANALRSAPALIDDALAGPAGEKLLARTRIRRGKAGRVGGAGAGAVAVGEEDAEGFDDADFYQQLLRDVIDARAGAEGGSGGGEAEWLAAQRSRKAKKVVDTKASKGRRLRYEVHEKLQNFMVPVPVPGQWHEQQIDELFASLLGRGFEHATAGADEDEGGGVQMEVGQDGFRVFG